jgi:pyruvate formate lyase activating enzyme
LSLYTGILGQEIEPDEIKKTIALVAKFPSYEFHTTIAPVIRGEGESPEISYMTPDEIGETASLIEEATGSKKNPYFLKFFDPKQSSDEALKAVETLPDSAMFKYRTAARRHQVLTEIKK